MYEKQLLYNSEYYRSLQELDVLMTNYYALIAAAGESSRFGSSIPKQYHRLNQKTILETSIETLLAFEPLKKLIVVLHPEDQHWQTLEIAHHPKIVTTYGGETRTASVLNGLQYLSDFIAPNDFVLVHDAARPFVTLTDIHRLIDTVKDHPVGGILAAPVVDTLKYSLDNKHIDHTVPRQHLYRALTPQCFRFEKLFSALKQAKQTVTDEAMAMELAGHASLLVLGSIENNKITYFSELGHITPS